MATSKVGAIFGDKCVRIVDGVPTGAEIPAAAAPSAAGWFRAVACLPDLDDRVWDARLIGRDSADKAAKGARGRTPTSRTTHRRDGRTDDADGLPGQGTQRKEDEGGRSTRGGRAGMELVALALAHNSVEVSDVSSGGLGGLLALDYYWSLLKGNYSNYSCWCMAWLKCRWCVDMVSEHDDTEMFFSLQHGETTHADLEVLQPLAGA